MTDRYSGRSVSLDAAASFRIYQSSMCQHHRSPHVQRYVHAGLLVAVLSLPACGDGWPGAPTTPEPEPLPWLQAVVLDAVTGAKIIGARVLFQGTTDTSDGSGVARFYGVKQGTFPLAATNPGHVEYRTDVTIDGPRANKVVTLELQPLQ